MHVYCVTEPNGYPGDFDGENYVTPPEDRSEFVEARSAIGAKFGYRRLYHRGADFASLTVRMLHAAEEAEIHARWERERLTTQYANEPAQGPRRACNWHTEGGRYENVWFAHRPGDLGACAAVDEQPGGWQYLLFDRWEKKWFVRRPDFYPSREDAQAAAEDALSVGLWDWPLRLLFPWEIEEGAP